MIRKIIRIAAVVLLIAGAAVYFFPDVSQWQYQRRADQVIADFRQEVTVVKQNDPYLSDLYAVIQAYNKEIYENRQVNLKDPFSYQQASFDLTNWGFAENVVGSLHIPRMDIRLPVYLGATTENMSKGAVHLSQTSLPVGGVNTNCVIAAHRGYAKAAMFRNIQKLQAGDPIYITNPWGKMTYKVAEIKVILPTDIRQVCIKDGKDMVTLITCHPYRQHTQRYVVYCERVLDGK